jgi:PadR family transcriptional regulator, regulatory protein PadR
MPGSPYPILVRLADRDLLETTWDTDAPPTGHRATCTG